AALHAPVPQRRSRVADLLRRPVVRVTALVLVLLAIGSALIVHGTASHPAAQPRPSTPAASMPASPMPASPGSASPGSASLGPATSPAARAAVLLRDLDRIRELAFARRQVSLLARVYVSGPLLTQDAALLRRVVPAGCGLVGVRTTYAQLQADVVDDRLVLATTATLAPSTLTCHATASSGAAGEKPTRLRIELVHRPDGYRIASQQKV
ncbi:MAG TPA: hypothetical protein VE074_04520, partial [Jatrophihabitantaceae bacterium]|nr:hypothetical protein [Jatrophihabitantaceae bacterium]